MGAAARTAAPRPIGTERESHEDDDSRTGHAMNERHRMTAPAAVTALSPPAGRSDPADVIVVVGSLNADLVVTTERHPQPGETVRGGNLSVIPGGKSANQAVAASRLGGRVRLIGAVGDDANGDLLRTAAAAAGVDVAGVQVRPGTVTGTAVITVDAAGENTIVISPGANALVNADQIGARTFDGAAALVLCLEIPIDVVLTAARTAAAAGVTVVTNLSPYQRVPRELLTLTDVLLLNDHEAQHLVGATGATSTSELRDALAAHHIQRAIVTRGVDGCLVFDGPAPVVHVPTVQVTAVDTTGCGDAFTGALAFRLACGDTVVAAAQFATKVGAYAATKPGAQSSFPTAAELCQFLSGREPARQNSIPPGTTVGHGSGQ